MKRGEGRLYKFTGNMFRLHIKEHRHTKRDWEKQER